MKTKRWLRVELLDKHWYFAGYRTTPQMNGIVSLPGPDWASQSYGPSINTMTWRGRIEVVYLHDTLMQELPDDPDA